MVSSIVKPLRLLTAILRYNPDRRLSHLHIISQLLQHTNFLFRSFAIHPAGQALERQCFTAGQLVIGRRFLILPSLKWFTNQFTNGLNQFVFQTRIVSTGLLIVDLGKIGFVAALLQHTARRNVARHVIRPCVDPQARPVKFPLKTNSVIYHHFARKKHHCQLIPKFPDRQRITYLRRNRSLHLQFRQHRFGQLMIEPTRLQLCLPMLARLRLGQGQLYPPGNHAGHPAQ